MPFFRPTDAAASTSIAVSHLLPCRIPTGLFLPADSCSPVPIRPGGQVRRRSEPGYVRAGLGHDDLRHLRPDSGNGLQQVDLVLPRPARRGDHCIQLSQRGLDQPPDRRSIERASWA